MGYEANPDLSNYLKINLKDVKMSKSLIWQLVIKTQKKNFIYLTTLIWFQVL